MNSNGIEKENIELILIFLFRILNKSRAQIGSINKIVSSRIRRANPKEDAENTRNLSLDDNWNFL